MRILRRAQDERFCWPISVLVPFMVSPSNHSKQACRTTCFGLLSALNDLPAPGFQPLFLLSLPCGLVGWLIDV